MPLSLKGGGDLHHVLALLSIILACCEQIAELLRPVAEERRPLRLRVSVARLR